MVILNSIIDRVDFNFPYVAAFFQSSPSILCIPSGPYFLLLLMASGFSVSWIPTKKGSGNNRITGRMVTPRTWAWWNLERSPSSSAPSNRFPSAWFLQRVNSKTGFFATSYPFLAWELRRCIPRSIPSYASAFFVYAYASRDGGNGLLKVAFLSFYGIVDTVNVEFTSFVRDTMIKDIRLNGPQSYYIKKIMGRFW